MAAITLLFDGVRTAATITRRVIVFYSGGKDSAVVLDLCARYFDEVRPVFMQLGPVLSFQRACLSWAEESYGVAPLVVPHPMLAKWLRYGTYRHHRLKIAPEARHLGFSFRSLMGRDMYQIHKFYPDDYEALRSWFPLLGTAVAQYEFGLTVTGASIRSPRRPG